ncbi:MAG: 50S ribosomal protein L28 [Myxococcota bacterium]
MARKCMLTGKRPNVANKVSHSNRKSKKRQLPNLQARRFWWVEGECFVKLRVSTRAMRTIDKLGLHDYARQAGVDLNRFRVDGPAADASVEA